MQPFDDNETIALEVIDATLAGEAVEPEYAELAELTLILAGQRPLPSAEFASRARRTGRASLRVRPGSGHEARAALVADRAGRGGRGRSCGRGGGRVAGGGQPAPVDAVAGLEQLSGQPAARPPARRQRPPGR